MTDQAIFAMEEQRRRERVVKDLKEKKENTDRILKEQKEASEQMLKAEQQARERYQAQQRGLQQAANREAGRSASAHKAQDYAPQSVQQGEQPKQLAAVRPEQQEHHSKVTRPPEVIDRSGLSEIQERWRRHEEAQFKRLTAMERASPAERAKLEREYADAHDRMLADSYKRQASWERNPEQKAALEKKAAEHAKAVEHRQQQDLQQSKQAGRNYALERVQERNNALRQQAGERREPPHSTQIRITRAEEQLERQQGIERTQTREQSQARQETPKAEASERREPQQQERASNPALDRVQERNRSVERNFEQQPSSQSQARIDRAERQLEQQRAREQQREQMRQQQAEQQRVM